MKSSVLKTLVVAVFHASVSAQAADLAPGSQDLYSSTQHELIGAFERQSALVGTAAGDVANIANVSQSGEANLAIVTQIGSHNLATIDQSGGGRNTALISQVGNNMVAAIAQHGNGNIALISQR